GDSKTKFDLDTWPVSDRMVFYVRKDVAAQLWDFGIGSSVGSNLPEDPFNNLRCDTCGAELAITSPEVALTNPRGVAVSPEGEVFVMDTQNARVVVYDKDGKFSRQFGTLSVVNEASPSALPGTFREPWGIDITHDGMIVVADTWNHRIQIFDKNGTPIR